MHVTEQLTVQHYSHMLTWAMRGSGTWMRETVHHHIWHHCYVRHITLFIHTICQPSSPKYNKEKIPRDIPLFTRLGLLHHTITLLYSLQLANIKSSLSLYLPTIIVDHRWGLPLGFFPFPTLPSSKHEGLFYTIHSLATCWL